VDQAERERRSPLFGAPLAVVGVDAVDSIGRPPGGDHGVLVGIDPEGRLPTLDPAPFDVLLTAAHDPPRPWVGVGAEGLDSRVTRLGQAVGRTPTAAALLCSVLRLTEGMPVEAALEVESLAYSTLLGGQEFRDWRAAHPPGPADAMRQDGPVLFARDGDQVTLTLNRPERRNATDAGMRDALTEALAAVLDDPTRPRLTLRGAGRCFSVGGDLDEFGAATDLARAHLIRSLRSPARLLHALGAQATVVFHGACIGAGVEIGAAARRRLARPGAFFQLPEVSMGLIPGAGGTVTVARAVGRHRAAYLALTGARLSAAGALAFGLVDAVSAT